ncbi:adenylosuccinate lyase [Variovorax boronicumulans]|uniref:Adenylosuccinate lyase n=1 Tax=Variovorax boronicumulans TaxID=436515 RepID=A0AAW8D529_9BURK|nr:lyase family protein [Variovorax boronicumulans]MDP9895006.1 adenylosuccinate lyase [Variovorax boronicumulans]MDQ0038499.1 adenylosuccinate lyase [Variovorax boronicumulans]MDQ0044662.1 adenylosuccinate lyase [Variovorax boronicumulans]MDQ0054675.1 adenylosuccinate lyase [Variovorax boronicumulans]
MICLDDNSCNTAFGKDIRDIFSAGNSIHLIMQVEAALARVQTRFGIVPATAAEEITAKATQEHFLPRSLAHHRARVGHPLVAVLEAWKEHLSAEAQEWVHFGATTADVFNTVLIMQLRQAGAAFRFRMREIGEGMALLAERHRTTPMVARTLGRHALPFTFGMKVGVWLTEHCRSMERLERWQQLYQTGILSGAAGTYAALGQHGPKIEAEVMAELGLGEPEAVDWKGSRDRFAELGCNIAMAARAYGHVAQEIFLLAGDDIDELREAGSAVGSSTMPHKSNPTLCIEVISRSREVSARLSPLMEWMMVIYDRDSEQHGDVLRDMCVGLGDVIETFSQLIRTLVVMPENMARNLERTQGMVYSEAITFALAERVGKQSAYAAMKKAVALARESGCTLQQAVAKAPEFSSLLEYDGSVLTAGRNIGLAPEVADAAVRQARSLLKSL